MLTFLLEQIRLKTLVTLAVVAAVLVPLRARYSIALTDGLSMSPTMAHGDLIVVDHWAYRKSTPERGDLVIANGRGEVLVKRVVGLPGDDLMVSAGLLYIGGLLVPEPYISEDKMLEITRGQLYPDRFALVGDNRALSSRELVHAIVPARQIEGRVAAVLSLSWSKLISGAALRLF